MTDGNASQDAVVIERTFDAPADLIWQMWTEPEHFKAWYGPDGATIPVAKMDVRAGGSRLVCMEMDTPGGLMQMVGETGWQLSHGEQSRLYIARALLQRAELVVLDESFAALDPDKLSILIDGVAVLVEHGLAAGAHSERPGRSGRQRPLGQGFVRGGRRLPVAGPDSRLDHFRQ